MYLDCLRCQKLGESCDGPNFLALSAAQILDWCKQRKAILGWTNAKLAEESDTPKGTIDRLLSGSYMDYRYETIRPVLKALVGCDNWGKNPCDAPPVTVDPSAGEKLEQQAATIHDLKKEKYRLEHELDMAKQHAEHLEAGKAERLETIAFLRDQLKSRRNAVAIMGAVIGVLALLVAIALIIDYLNPSAGFFWLE